MFARSRALAVLIGVALVTRPAIGWADVFPPEELWGGAVEVSVEVTGLARFPDHVFYVYPVYCTRELAKLLDVNLLWDDEEDGGRPNYIELRDGPLASWLDRESECTGSILYALARDVAAGVDFDAMSLAALNTFFTEDPRLFHSSFEFVERPLYASKGSPLTAVEEVVRVLAIDPFGISAVVDSATYWFSDGTVQTLKLGHTRRPPLPFRPLKPEKVAKYAMVNAKWEVRQAVGPAVAPRLPDGAEVALAGSTDSTGSTDSAGDSGTTGAVEVAGAGAVGAGTAEIAGAAEVAVASTPDVAPAQPERVPAAERVVEVRPVEAAVKAEVEAAPAPAPVAAPAPVLDPFSARAWPLGAGLAGLVLLICGAVFVRRRAAGSRRA